MRFVFLAWLALTAAHARGAEHLTAGPAAGRIVVHAFKAGLFSGFAHDHHFAVTQWTATAEVPAGDPARASVEIVLSADSLHDTQQSLSVDDRRQVDARAAGPDVLDAAHHPRITFRSERIALSTHAADVAKVSGTAHGTLTARGRSIPLDVPFEAERVSSTWRVRGTARMKQSALGIRPFNGFAGTVKVKDELEVEFAIVLAPDGS